MLKAILILLIITLLVFVSCSKPNRYSMSTNGGSVVVLDQQTGEFYIYSSWGDLKKVNPLEGESEKKK